MVALLLIVPTANRPGSKLAKLASVLWPAPGSKKGKSSTGPAATAVTKASGSSLKQGPGAAAVKRKGVDSKRTAAAAAAMDADSAAADRPVDNTQPSPQASVVYPQPWYCRDLALLTWLLYVVGFQGLTNLDLASPLHQASQGVLAEQLVILYQSSVRLGHISSSFLPKRLPWLLKLPVLYGLACLRRVRSCNLVLFLSAAESLQTCPNFITSIPSSVVPQGVQERFWIQGHVLGCFLVGIGLAGAEALAQGYLAKSLALGPGQARGLSASALWVLGAVAVAASVRSGPNERANTLHHEFGK